MLSAHVFPRHTKADLPIAVGGDGPFVVDADGKRYLDACGGAAVSCLGHSDAKLKAAIHDQVDKLAYAHTSFFTTDPAEDLAERLADWRPAISTASISFPAARKPWSRRSSWPASSIWKTASRTVRPSSPAGRAIMATRSARSRPAAIAGGAPSSSRCSRRPCIMSAPATPIAARCPAKAMPTYTDRLAQELEDKILELGPNTVAAFLAEPVVGATMGAVPPVAGYFAKMKAVCDRHGVLMILDEVMCGMGRTGTLFACEQEGIEPDMIAIAKGLGAGFSRSAR
jgi:adenosylmethionine-8-amino-7-oxononanoate aminotransferase